MRKKKILIILGLPPLNFFGKQIINKRTRILKELGDNYEFSFLSFINPKRVEKILDMNIISNIIDFSEYMKLDNWPDSYKMIDEMLAKYDFDRIFYYYSQPVQTAVAGKEHIILKSYIDSQTTRTKAYMTFSYAKSIWKKLHLICHIGTKLPITHFTDDPLEIDITKFSKDSINFFFYDQKKLNLTYFPFIEYDDIYFTPLVTNYEKEFDLTFGCSAVSDSADYRYEVIGKLLNLEDDFNKLGIKYNFYFKDRSRNIENFIPKTKYDELINKSKYTLIIPSYDKDEFSLIRYFEAIRSGCIPLVSDDCSIDKAFESLPLLKKLIVFYNYDNLIEVIQKTDYKKLIEKMVNCEDFQKFLHPEFYREYLEKYKKFFN